MPSEVENRGAPILFDVRPLFGILGYVKSGYDILYFNKENNVFKDGIGV